MNEENNINASTDESVALPNAEEASNVLTSEEAVSQVTEEKQEEAKTLEGEATTQSAEEHYIRTEFGYITEAQYAIKLAERKKRREEQDRIARRKKAQNPLILSLFGVFFSIFIGVIGLVLSIVGLSTAAVQLKTSKAESLKWARNLGICGIIISVVFMACFIAFCIHTGFQPDPGIENVPIE